MWLRRPRAHTSLLLPFPTASWLVGLPLPSLSPRHPACIPSCYLPVVIFSTQTVDTILGESADAVTGIVRTQYGPGAVIAERADGFVVVDLVYGRAYLRPDAVLSRQQGACAPPLAFLRLCARACDPCVACGGVAVSPPPLCRLQRLLFMCRIAALPALCLWLARGGVRMVSHSLSQNCACVRATERVCLCVCPCV